MNEEKINEILNDLKELPEPYVEGEEKNERL